MNALSDAELRDAIGRRDAQGVGNFEIRFTDPSAWLATLEADVDLNAIADNIVWLAVTSGPATLEQIEKKWSSGGNREVRTFGSRYVTANYIARGQMQTLSAYCGVVWAESGKPNQFARDLSEATALRLQETLRKVQVGLSKCRTLQVRSGGALHLHNVDEPWVAHPDQGIEVPLELSCADCGEAIYFANNQWRHKGSGRAEVLIDARGRSGPIRKLSHLADPVEAGRTL